MILNIEKLVYGGDGLARLPGNEVQTEKQGRGKAVFVPFVLSGERVEVEIAEEHPGFSRAHLKAVAKPSPERITPECPHFGQCGGCHYQQAGYEHQLQIKAEILRENLRRLAKLELKSEIRLHASPPWQYRNRTRVAVRAGKGAEFVLGYRRAGSESVLAVETCPISSPLLGRAIAAVWRLGRSGGVPEAIREVEFFADAEDLRVVAVLYAAQGINPKDESLAAFAGKHRSALSAVESVSVLSERNLLKIASNDAVERPRKILGPGSLKYAAGGHAYRVSAGSFFQGNRHMVEPLMKLVTEGKSGGTALDLYAGVGLFSLPLAAHFGKVIAVESSPLSHGDLSYNSPANVKAIRATTDAYLAEVAGKLAADLIVVDPPRTGLGNRTARSLARMNAPVIMYVSCDPATLARDLGPLMEAGYRVEQAHVVDLFPQTYHLETVLELAR